MAMSIKTSPELWGEDARAFDEEAERNGKLPTPKLSESQRKILTTMLNSAKNFVFPPKKDTLQKTASQLPGCVNRAIRRKPKI